MQISRLVLTAALAFAGISGSTIAAPIDGTYTANTLPANDDGSTSVVNLGFNFNFFGTTYTQLWVNNNGNVTFNSPLSTFTPFGLTSSIGTPIIAPFFADVWTFGNSGLVTYEAKASGVAGHPTFGVEWPHVNYYADNNGTKQNTFELLLVSRPDVGVGDADIYFNYGPMQWETGSFSGGVNGLGGSCAHVGYSNGTGNPGTNYEVPGSGVCGGLINGGANQLVSATNDGVPGQYLFQVRNGVVTPNPTVPEPGSLALVGLGFAALGAIRRRKCA